MFQCNFNSQPVSMQCLYLTVKWLNIDIPFCISNRLWVLFCVHFASSELLTHMNANQYKKAESVVASSSSSQFWSMAVMWLMLESQWNKHYLDVFMLRCKCKTVQTLPMSSCFFFVLIGQRFTQRFFNCFLMPWKRMSFFNHSQTA